MSNKYVTKNEFRNGKIVKVVEPIKKHELDKEQRGLDNQGNYRTSANDAIIVPVWEKILLTIEEASKMTNIGISKLYELTGNPTCNFVLHTGSRKRLIKRKEFEKYLSKSIEI